MQAEIEKLFDEKPATYTDDHFHLFQRFKQALNAGEIRAAEPDSSTKTGWRVNAWVKKGILLGFRMGAVVDMSINSTRQPWFDKATFPGAALHGRSRHSHCSRRIQHSRWLLHRQRRDVHAAHVHQHRELGGRWLHDRFARAGGKLRAGGSELPYFGGGADRRSAGAGGRAAGDHRRRSADGRQHRRLRRHGGEAARGARLGRHLESLHAGVRCGARPDPSRHR